MSKSDCRRCRKQIVVDHYDERVGFSLQISSAAAARCAGASRCFGSGTTQLAVSGSRSLSQIMQLFDNDRDAAQLETKWIESGELTPEELEHLDFNRANHPDATVRERCRVLRAAIEKRYEGDSAVEALLCERHWTAFVKLIQPFPGDPSDKRQP